VKCPDEFTEFAAAEMARLRRTAYLLCGEWHGAEDLTQIALTKTLLAWRRISKRENAHAYAHRTLINAYLSQRRTRRSGEVPVHTMPERTSPPGTAELRVVMLAALATLPPQARAVVVLRYWEDLSIEQVADVMRCSAGAARKTRRRQLTAGIAVAAAIIPALVFGVPAITGALAPAGPAPAHSGHASKPRHATATPHPGAPAFIPPLSRSYYPVQPVLPAEQSEVDPVSITSQSIGQLLIDDLPAGAQPDQLMANADANAGDPSAVGQNAEAIFLNVITKSGSGSVDADLLHYTTGFFGQVCSTTPTPGETCVIYHLADGIEVAEDVSYGVTGDEQLNVTVFRPGVANIEISEMNSEMGGQNSASMPLTMAQMVKAALDPRWAFTISQSFVQHASGLRVAPLPSS
jgi:RNA polymerase sigma-70 factor (sigma-E family)